MPSLAAVLTCAALAAAPAERPQPTTRPAFGAEARASADPIGGGKDYTRLVDPARADATVRSAKELAAALARAKAGQVIYVPGEIEIDLTTRIRAGKGPLAISAGVTLAGGRGRDGSPGALLVSKELKTQPLLHVAGPGARVTGLRLVGPDGERRTAEMRRRLKEGGHKLYYAWPTSDGIRCAHAKLEVDNCELSGWSHAGVFLRKGASAHVHHNDIHHCQRSGLGYGVCLDQAEARVEANRFDYVRHAIAGTGRPGTSYEALGNLVLPHANGHSFDMHGGRDRKDGTHVAGTWIRIHHNTFQATGVPAVVIRGLPQKLCDVHHNWFRHTTKTRAVRQSNKRGNLRVHDNRYGPKAAPAP